MAKPYKRPPNGASDKFLVRLPPGMRERIALAAQRNGRTLTAEIVDVLEREFPPVPSISDIFEQIDFLSKMYDYSKDDDITNREMMQVLSVLKTRMEELRKSREDKQGG